MKEWKWLSTFNFWFFPSSLTCFSFSLYSDFLTLPLILVKIYEVDDCFNFTNIISWLKIIINWPQQILEAWRKQLMNKNTKLEFDVITSCLDKQIHKWTKKNNKFYAVVIIFQALTFDNINHQDFVAVQ